MNVLFLSLEFVLPPDRGLRVRTLSQLRLLASLDAVESITLISLRDEEIPPERLQALEKELPRVRVLPPIFQPTHMRKHARYVPRLLGLRAVGVPYLIARCDNPVVRGVIERELRTGKYDVVYFGYLGMTTYLRTARALAPRARVVLEEHNVEWRIFDSLADTQERPMYYVWKLEAAALRAYERRTLRDVDTVIAISEADARELAGLAGTQATVIAPVCEPRAPRTETTTAPRVAYLGQLAWQPNVYGLDWFCQKVWPLVRARNPEATLTIAGSGLRRREDGTLAVPATWNGPGITTIGFVESLEAFFGGSLVMVAPVIGGSGVRIKLLEGMSAGMPTVTTTDGAAGLDVTDGCELLVADEPSEYAEKIVRALSDGALRASLRDAGYSYLRTHHAAKLAKERLERALGLGP